MSKRKFKYIDVYERIKTDLLEGKCPAGGLFPTEDELVDIYKSSKTTIRHAVKLLVQDHCLHVQQGRGTLVLPFAQLFKNKKYSQLSDLNVDLVTDGPGFTMRLGGFIEAELASAELAQIMGIRTRDKIFCTKWVQFVDGRAYGYTSSCFCAEAVPEIENLKQRPADNMYETLRQQYGILIDYAQDTIDATPAPTMVANQLGVAPGTPLLLIRRRAFREHQLIEYCETYLRTDIFQLSIHMDSEKFYLKNEIENIKGDIL